MEPDMDVVPDYYKYDMSHKKRGLALIINNMIFTGMPNREGSLNDTNNMKEALENLDFTVIIRHNRTALEMKELLINFGTRDHKNSDCFVCVILTHGNTGDMLFGSDGRCVSLEEIILPILPNKCKSLAGKPKLIFVSACRGTKLDVGVDECDARETDSVRVHKIPLWADLLVAYSTVPGFYSWRDVSQGTWFIRSLSSVLLSYGHWMELQAMLTIVNNKVALQFQSETEDPNWRGMKQVPCISSMLIKQVYFLPKNKLEQKIVTT